MSKSLLICFLFISSSAFSQELSDFWLDLSTRYDNEDYGERRSRIQNGIRLGFSIDFRGELELIGLMSSGERYTSRWSTAHDFNGEGYQELKLYFRHLYLQKYFLKNKLRTQLGVIPPVKNIVSNNSIEPVGWVDGVRIEYKDKKTVYEMVIGKIGEFNNPNAFYRKPGVNFFELEISHELFKNTFVEVAGEYLDGDYYTKGEVKQLINRNKSKFLEIVFEGLRNVSQSSNQFGATARFWPLNGSQKTFGKRLNTFLNYSYSSKDIGTRGQISDEFRIGHFLNAGIEVRFLQRGKWFFEFHQPLKREYEDSSPINFQRFKTGLQIKFSK